MVLGIGLVLGSGLVVRLVIGIARIISGGALLYSKVFLVVTLNTPAEVSE